jgi:hypothetical protein
MAATLLIDSRATARSDQRLVRAPSRAELRLPAGWQEDDLDDLRAAKGIITAAALSLLLFWLPLIALAWFWSGDLL